MMNGANIRPENISIGLRGGLIATFMGWLVKLSRLVGDVKS